MTCSCRYTYKWKWKAKLRSRPATALHFRRIIMNKWQIRFNTEALTTVCISSTPHCSPAIDRYINIIETTPSNLKCVMGKRSGSSTGKEADRCVYRIKNGSSSFDIKCLSFPGFSPFSLTTEWQEFHWETESIITHNHCLPTPLFYPGIIFVLWTQPRIFSFSLFRTEVYPWLALSLSLFLPEQAFKHFNYRSNLRVTFTSSLLSSSIYTCTSSILCTGW